MAATDEAVSPSPLIPDLCNPSLLTSDASPMPALPRIDWLRNAMTVWCASAMGEATATHSPQLALMTR